MELERENHAARIDALFALARRCALCPRHCGVDRLAGEVGFCGIGATPLVASAGPHYGEEAPLVGRAGSGTIFLSGCNLGCVFCQNCDISHGRAGRPGDAQQIALAMLKLEAAGCHNVNLVTPSHVAAWLAQAIVLARQQGLAVPIVYNCGGYESVETLRLLEGLVEIYMPDAKFLDSEPARRYCDAEDYPDVLRAALREMHRQVGDLVVEGGLAVRGMLIRHLVMPGLTGDSLNVLEFIAEEVSPHSWVNLMDQYHPCQCAAEFPEINRPLTAEEFQTLHDAARRLGLNLL